MGHGAMILLGLGEIAQTHIVVAAVEGTAQRVGSATDGAAHGAAHVLHSRPHRLVDRRQLRHGHRRVEHARVLRRPAEQSDVDRHTAQPGRRVERLVDVRGVDKVEPSAADGGASRQARAFRAARRKRARGRRASF